jgi:hypothetical protein
MPEISANKRMLTLVKVFGAAGPVGDPTAEKPARVVANEEEIVSD